MKAVLCAAYGPPDVLRVADVRKPVPGKGEILIRVRATSGVNAMGSDLSTPWGQIYNIK